MSQMLEYQKFEKNKQPQNSHTHTQSPLPFFAPFLFPRSFAANTIGIINYVSIL